MRFSIDGETRLGEDYLVEVLLVHLQGYLVDRGHVNRLDYGCRIDVTEEGHLLAQVQRKVMLGAQHENIRLNTHLLQLFHRVLRGLGLQLFGCGDIGHIGKVYAHTVLTQLPTQLAHAFEIRQRLDVAHRTADFSDNEIELILGTQQLDVTFDFVGNVRNDLYRFSQIIATALLVDDILIDATGRDVVGPGRGRIGETLVVAQVQVGFMAVDRHITLSMFIRVQRARVDIDIGIEFLNRHLISACQQQPGQ